MELYFYHVTPEYIDFLKDKEIAARGFTCVPNVKYKYNQKFVFGSVMNFCGINYFVPVSSYSKKQQDNILIRDKKNQILGSLRFTYMIPVPKSCCSKLNIAALENPKSIAHVSKELAFCRRNREKIMRQAYKTYDRVTNLVSELLVKNSCDFKLLESAYFEYCTENNIELTDEEINHMLDIAQQQAENQMLEV